MVERCDQEAGGDADRFFGVIGFLSGARTRRPLRFLEDGDEVIMRAECIRASYPRIGFGAASATVLPAKS